MAQLNGDRSNNLNNNRRLSTDSKTEINSLLEAVADCASALLGDNDFESGVNKALKILGTSIGADRLGINEHHDDPTGQTLGYVVAKYEWLASETESQLYHSELSRIPYDGVEDCYYMFVSGRYWGGLLENMPEPFRSGQKKLGVQATYAIPVIVKEKYWGIIGLDFCRTARELCEAEIAVLKTAATCIGSAIQRERNRQSKEAAERKALLQQQKAKELQKRDRLLNITAQAAKALLNDINLERAIAKALRIVGEGIDTDRVCVMEHHEDTGSSLGFARTLFEWNSPYAVSQLKHPELQQVSYDGIEDWYEKLRQGEAVGGDIEELPEAIRQGQLELGVKSMYAVPIIVEEKYWGVVGFDDCREAKQRTESEISILKATAACIGSAIQQSRISRQREQAERQALVETEKAVQLTEHNLVLEQRDRILVATAEASDILLTGENFNKAINQALQIIGNSIDTDRVTVIENWYNPSKSLTPYWRILYEWNSTYVIPQISHPDVTQGSYEGIEKWYELQSQGQSISCRLEEMPEPFRSGQAKIGVKVLHAVPIFVEGKHWGIVGFDDCREETRRSEAELSLLKTAANCIGGAIQQKRIRLAKEEADRNILLEREQAAIEKAEQLRESNLVLSLRDKWLEATANAANKLLEISDLDEGINAALKVLGESLDCDRVAVMQNFEDSTEKSLGYIKLVQEWDSPGISRQISHSELVQIPSEGIEDWFLTLKAGGWIGGILKELKGPFRTAMAQLNVKSTYAVSIFVKNSYWGAIGVDFCREARRLTPAEIAVFKTAASCVGSAIARQQIQQAKEEADRNILLEREQAAIEKAKQLEESNLVLSLRDKWLEATANAANKLLEIADLNEGINAALKVLGESLECDRIGIMQYFEEDSTVSSQFVCQKYEWNSAGIVSQIDHPRLHKISNLGMEKYFAKIIAGEWIGSFIEEFPEPFRSGQIELGVKSTYAVPIFVNNQFWGILGIDFCREVRRLTLSEIAVFKTAASCIGSTISRQQIQQSKEEAERNILLEREQAAVEKAEQLQQSNLVLSSRDQWLEATANAANKLLEIADLDEGINAALKVLGESLNCDRVAVMQHFEDDTEECQAFLRGLYEWNSTYAIRQISHPKLNKISWQGMEDWLIEMKAGEFTGGTIDEIHEPFRSEQIELGVKSTYAVPIFVGNVFWGILATDFCREPRRLTLPEIAVFKTAASCVGSAIFRQQIQQEKDRAELAVLDERNRMAREIHDTLAQAFTGISLQLEAAKSSLTTESDVVRQRLIQAKNLAKEGITEARRSVRALRPEVLELGLIAALQQLIDKMYSGTDIKVEMVIEGESYNLNSAIEAELFRIAQEAITNSLRSAHASEVCIQLVYEADAIHLKIEDDGIGFNPELLSNQGFGLLGMQERSDRLNGNLVLNSAIGKGTEITVTVEIS